MTTLARARRALRGYEPKPEDQTGATPAAVAVILVEGKRGVETLFIKRAERVGDPWSGQVAFPGGRRDVGDLDLLATAIRETREETGVDLERAERLAQLDDLRPRTPTLPPILVRPFVFALDERPDVAPSQETQASFWVPLGELLEPAVRRAVSVTIRGIERAFPAYVIGDLVIWGMTERILTPLLELMRGAR